MRQKDALKKIGRRNLTLGMKILFQLMDNPFYILAIYNMKEFKKKINFSPCIILSPPFFFSFFLFFFVEG